MASRRRNYAKTIDRKRGRRTPVQHERFCFIHDLLEGRITATTMDEVRAGNRFVRLEYDDPNG